MFNASKKHTLLFVIFAFAFAYRIFLLLWQTYPPGSDIGFHASVMNSITQSGNTNFLMNSYQMGGEIELEFPGYYSVNNSRGTLQNFVFARIYLKNIAAISLRY